MVNENLLDTSILRAISFYVGEPTKTSAKAGFEAIYAASEELVKGNGDIETLFKTYGTVSPSTALEDKLLKKAEVLELPD